MRITTDNSLALVIDYQERLVPAMFEPDALQRHAEILLKGLRVLEIPMIISQQYTKGIGMTLAPLLEAAATTDYYDKLAFSCYDDENIRKAIETSGKQTIIVCGTEAHVCVLQTCIDLKAAGYEVVMVTDCVGSRRPHDKKIGLKRAVQEGVLLTTYEALLFELTRKAGSDTFKAISKLIK